MWKPDVKASTDPLYLAIVKALERDIADGSLQPGTRLPTQRDLARELDVALGTVTRAYTEMERRGLIRGEVGRGTFVGSPNADILPLGTPDLTPPRVIELSYDLPIHQEDPDLSSILRDLSTSDRLGELLRYHSHLGLPRHRDAGAAWIGQTGWDVSPSDVVVCAGTQQALGAILLTLTEPGDLIFTEELTYGGMKSIADHLHLRLEGLPIDEGGLIPEAFEKACTQRRAQALYCMPSLHNPTTAGIDLERRKEIARIAEYHDIAILEDDVHRHVAHDPAPPIASLVPRLGYYIASLSKAVSGALRVAFLAAPSHAIERLSNANWATHWMVPPLMAEIASTWIGDGTARQVATRKREEARARQEMAKGILGDGRIRTQSASYYIWLNVPAGFTSDEFAREARSRGVSVTPSDAFLVRHRGPPPFVRVCLGAAEDRDSLEQALGILNEITPR